MRTGESLRALAAGRGLPFFAISSVTGEGLENFVTPWPNGCLQRRGKLFRDCKQQLCHLGGIDDRFVSSVGLPRLLKPDRPRSDGLSHPGLLIWNGYFMTTP